jgi:hypothetical protein
MFILEKIVKEDHQESNGTLGLSEATLLGGSTKELGSRVKYTFSVFKGFCPPCQFRDIQFLEAQLPT